MLAGIDRERWNIGVAYLRLVFRIDGTCGRDEE